MKRSGVLIIVTTMILLFILPDEPMQLKFFVGAFGFGLGLVLMLISGAHYLHDHDD